MSVKIYWASRLVSGIEGINHHYALIVWEGERPTVSPFITLGSRFFITLGGHPSTPGIPVISDLGDLVFRQNEVGDETSARRIVPLLQDALPRGLGSSQYREVTPPSGNAAVFAQTLIRMAEHYRQYSAQHPIPYNMLGPNSNSWCNALFQAAGVSEQNRRRLRDFSGLDRAAEMPISMSYFGG